MRATSSYIGLDATALLRSIGDESPSGNRGDTGRLRAALLRFKRRLRHSPNILAGTCSVSVHSYTVSPLHMVYEPDTW